MELAISGLPSAAIVESVCEVIAANASLRDVLREFHNQVRIHGDLLQTVQGFVRLFMVEPTTSRRHAHISTNSTERALNYHSAQRSAAEFRCSPSALAGKLAVDSVSTRLIRPVSSCVTLLRLTPDRLQ